MKQTLGKKSTHALLLTIVAALVLSACSASNAPTKNTDGTGGNSGAEDKTKLTYWTMDRHDMDYMQQKINAYNTSNTDHIEVEMKVMADNYNQSLEVAFASNQAPDVFKVNDFEVYVTKGYLAPLDDLLSQQFLGQFDGVLKEKVTTLKGKVYSLPNTGQFWRLLYNVDLMEKAGFSEPPKTLDEMVEAAKIITEQGKSEGIYGFASNFKNGSGFTRPAYASGSADSGTSHEGFNYQTGEFDFAMYRDVAEALRQIKVDGSMIPGAESLDIDPLRAQFAQGKIGMYVNHSGEPSVYNSQFPTDINWSSTMIPTKTGEINGAIWVNAGAYIGVNAKSDKQDAAAKFIEFLYSTELRKEYQEKGLGISVLPYVNAAAGKPELKGIDGFLPTKYDAIFPVTPLAISETKLEGKKAADVFTEYILTGNQSIDDAIQDINTRYNKALAAARSEGLTDIEADPSYDTKALQGTLGNE